MSYSRWSNSTWYTFWTSHSEDMQFKIPTQRLKNNQIFEICDMVSYHVSYEELDELGVDIVIEQVQKFYSKSYDLSWFKNQETFKKDVTQEDLEELKTYLIRFMDDVDGHFRAKNFIMNEWIYPIKYKIKKFFLNR